MRALSITMVVCLTALAGFAPQAPPTAAKINYFRFDYAAPREDAPFAVTTEVTACPWNPAHKLALVGLRARPVEARDAARNLVRQSGDSGREARPTNAPASRSPT